MKLTIERLSDYSLSLDSCADNAASQVMERLVTRWQDVRDLDLNESVPIMREHAAAALVNAENTFGVSSAAIGHHMLADMVGKNPEHGIESMEVADEYADSQSARYWAKFIDGTDEGLEKFVNGVAERARRNVSHAADREVALASAKMGMKVKGVRFARVPKGPSCGFCIMLASRGFVYATRESAGEFTRFHDNCDCRVIAGINDMEVEGYDPKGLYDRYAQCIRAINGGTLNSSNGQIYEDWERLSEEEQAEWGKKAKNGKDAFNNYFAHRVCQELDTRDREWVWSGIPSDVPHISDGATPDDWEMKSADILWSNGLCVDFQPRSLALNDRRSDTVIDGVKWEMKNPTGCNPMTVFNQIKSVVFGKNKRVRNPQASCVIISNVRSSITAEELRRQARSVLDGGEFPEVYRVMIVDSVTELVFRVDA